MRKKLFHYLLKYYEDRVSAVPVGIFRILFGLVTFQEICFLIYFKHLIFDPIPYLDNEFPMIGFFLYVWLVIAFALTIGYRTQWAVIVNYLFWIIFVNFTPMQRDFDGGFDLFMIGTNFFMIFMPLNKALSIDGLRKKLRTPFVSYRQYSASQVTPLSINIPILICLGFLYFDSVIHKMFAEHWLNGMGAWLPSSMPFYVSALDLSWLLNIEWLQRAIGYSIIVFQFSFIFLFHVPAARWILVLVGAGLHLGITLSLNIYPFGIGMLIFYVLLLPPSFYKFLADKLQASKPVLSVFYDGECPLCCRTVLIINHFDIFQRIEFHALQSNANQHETLKSIPQRQLLKDIYAVDQQNKLFSGVETYAQILIATPYLIVFGWLLKLPGIYQLAVMQYRKIADSRVRVACQEQCLLEQKPFDESMVYDSFFAFNSIKDRNRFLNRMAKILLVIALLQLNSSIHYGLLYRFDVNIRSNILSATMTEVSNSIVQLSHAFLGITPHPLYLHDHFEGYHHLIAITYLDEKDEEKWLPFINSEGRMLAPNWGRVHSMWANIAVTPNIDNHRLNKFIMKITAFWGIKGGLILDETVFKVKLKKITVPFDWVEGLRGRNLSGSWETIGEVRWKGKDFMINLPENINLL